MPSLVRAVCFIISLSLISAMPFFDNSNMDMGVFGSVEEGYNRVISKIHSNEEKMKFLKDWLSKNHYLGKGDKDNNEIVGAAVMEAKQFYGVFPYNDEITDDLLKVMSEPRCSKTDRKSRTKRWTRLGGTTWKQMPVSIAFTNYLQSDKISKNMQRNLVRECATLWAEQTSLSFGWNTNGGANIEITFRYIDGPYGTVGSGQSPVPGRSRGSYLRLDTGEPWKVRMKDGGRGVSLKWAMCHEMGHNLGLGHSNDKQAVMYPSGVHGRSDDKLGRDDVNGITTLYGRSNGKTWVGPGSDNRNDRTDSNRRNSNDRRDPERRNDNNRTDSNRRNNNRNNRNDFSRRNNNDRSDSIRRNNNRRDFKKRNNRNDFNRNNRTPLSRRHPQVREQPRRVPSHRPNRQNNRRSQSINQIPSRPTFNNRNNQRNEREFGNESPRNIRRSSSQHHRVPVYHYELEPRPQISRSHTRSNPRYFHGSRPTLHGRSPFSIAQFQR